MTTHAYLDETGLATLWGLVKDLPAQKFIGGDIISDTSPVDLNSLPNSIRQFSASSSVIGGSPVPLTDWVNTYHTPQFCPSAATYWNNAAYVLTFKTNESTPRSLQLFIVQQGTSSTSGTTNPPTTGYVYMRNTSPAGVWLGWQRINPPTSLNSDVTVETYSYSSAADANKPASLGAVVELVNNTLVSLDADSNTY